MAGIDQLKVIFKDLADAISVVFKLAHHGGIFSAYPLLNDFSSLSALNAAELKAEVADLSVDERAQLVAILNGVDISDAGVKAKLQAAFADLNEGVDLGLEGYAVVTHALAYLAKLKALVA